MQRNSRFDAAGRRSGAVRWKDHMDRNPSPSRSSTSTRSSHMVQSLGTVPR